MEAEKPESEEATVSSTEDNALTNETVTKTASETNGEGGNSETTQSSAGDVGGTDANDEEKQNVDKNEESLVEKTEAVEQPVSETKIEEKSEPEGNKDTQVQESPPKAPEKDDTLPTNEADITMPPIQTLGKGKRARIPNKRYSDIVLSPVRSSHKPNENGEHDAEDEEMSNLSDVTSRKSRSDTSSPTPKKSRVTVDMSDPKYRKPFLHGWKRELVYRATFDNPNKRNGDIYYYSPMGKKIRSMRELTEVLKGHKELTVDNFTFYKEPLGLDDPEKEIIRDAKAWNKKATAKSGSKTPNVLSPKAGTSKVSSPKTPDSETPQPTRRSGRSLGNIKNLQIKLAPSKTRSDRSSKVEEEPMDVESSLSKRSSAKKTTKAPPKPVESSRSTRRSAKLNNTSNEKQEESRLMDSYLQDVAYGYNTLLHVFQYLKVQDLLRAGCVCTMWRDIASHPSLWRTVRMKNSQVHSFEGLANTLEKHGTVHLDLRKMLLPMDSGDEIWPEFSKAIQKVQTLRKIDLSRCPASVVEQLAITNKDLEVINGVTIVCQSMSLDTLSSLKNLKELRLKSPCGLTLSSDITSLKELTSLTHLSLTSIKDLNKMSLSVIAALKNLESLDLGECNDFPGSFGAEILMKLTKLEKLRLEKGQGDCHTSEILEAVRQMPDLEQLELVNFDIKSGFDVALGACSNIKKLLLIPTYISQSATTNHVVLAGMLRLKSTLSHLVWGVTLELLRVTELFVDQYEDSDKKKKKSKKAVGKGDCIPVLKPVPLLMEKDEEIPPAHDPPKVEIIPLPDLQKLLLKSLPTTRVKILKIPFHATWRQSITDTVN